MGNQVRNLKITPQASVKAGGVETVTVKVSCLVDVQLPPPKVDKPHDPKDKPLTQEQRDDQIEARNDARVARKAAVPAAALKLLLADLKRN